MKRFLVPIVALTAPALAQTRALPPGEIPANGDITFGNALKLGRREAGKTVITPDKLQILDTGSSAPTFAVGRQASPDGFPGGLIIGGAGADEGGAGSIISADGIANWTRIQPSKNYNPQEFNIYGTQAQGAARGTAGSNTITRVTSSSGDPGSAFNPGWVGRLFYWGRSTYRVASVTNSNTLTVTTPTGGAVSFPSTKTDRYHYIRTTGTGRVNVSGTAVTRISGDPFVPFYTGTDFLLRINGVAYTIASFTDKDRITLTSSAGTQTNVPFDYSLNINDQIAAVRVQKTIGLDEENLTISARATGEYEIRVGGAKKGQFYPLRFYNGASNGAPTMVMEINPASVSLGGTAGSEALRIDTVGGLLNRLEIAGGSAGFGPSITSRGAETNIPINIDAKGSGGVNVTGNNYGQTLFQVIGSTLTGASWATVAPGAVPTIQPGGSDANAPLRLLGRGLSGVFTGAFIRAADPTTADIPTGQCVDWQNTTANTFRHICNFGGTLRGVAMAPI